jgi:hypothetical protein
VRRDDRGRADAVLRVRGARARADDGVPRGDDRARGSAHDASGHPAGRRRRRRRRRRGGSRAGGATGPRRRDDDDDDDEDGRAAGGGERDRAGVAVVVVVVARSRGEENVSEERIRIAIERRREVIADAE